jgi:hypothetical protein
MEHDRDALPHARRGVSLLAASLVRPQEWVL